MGQQKSWYAIYSKSRSEKRVFEELKSAGIESYLPLIKVLKQWSDRKKWVELPLFRSYLFVNIEKKDYYKVLNIQGVVRYITFEGRAVAIPPGQILAIKQYINSEDELFEYSGEFSVGDQVEIYRGQLKGLSGHLIDIHGKQKVKIEIEGIGHSIALTIPKSYLKLIKLP